MGGGQRNNVNSKRICSSDKHFVPGGIEVAGSGDHSGEVGEVRRVGTLADSSVRSRGVQEAGEAAPSRKANAKEIDPATLPYVLLADKRRLPQSVGVYFVIEENGEIAYIGQSTNIRNRWRGVQHKAYRRFADRLFVRIAWLEVAQDYLGLIRTRGYDYLGELENGLITRFNPKLNGALDCQPGDLLHYEVDKATKKGATK